MSDKYAQRPTWAEINLDNLAFNFHSVKKFVGLDYKYMAVVKADAYGHSAVPCARRLEKEGIDWFGVALPEEGFELRNAGIRKHILCLGSFWLGQENLLLNNHLTPVIYQIDKAESFNCAARDRGIIASIHIKIDTGMGRLGVRYDELNDFAEKIKTFRHIRVEGLMTHFASADKLEHNEFTNLQIKRFNEALANMLNKGFPIIYKDLSNSPGAVAHPEAGGNLMRLGGVLYGLVEDVLPSNIEIPRLKAVMSIYTKIAHLKKVPKGETLGYGRTFTTQQDSMIATIPIGYQDGLPRALSNTGQVLINGHFAPIVGRVSMDWTIIDVSNIPNVTLEDEVVIIGTQNSLAITAEEVARKSKTISYEITCGINRRVARKYVGSE